MQTDTGDDLTAGRALDRLTVLKWAYLIGLVFLVVGLILTINLIVAAVVAFGIHVLLHARVFELTATTTFVTSQPVESATAEFSTAKNPLTSLWIADAEEGTVSAGEDNRSVAFTISGPLNIGSQHFTIEVTEIYDGERRIEIRRGENAIVTVALTFESIRDGTRMIVTSERTSVHLLALFLITAAGSEVQSELGERGYETIDTERSIGLRSLTGS